MDGAELSQLIIAVFTAIAAVSSMIVTIITVRQYNLQKKEQIKKYRPFFKIKSYHSNSPYNYFFDIVNEGYPFFAISNISWGGNGVIIRDYFNAQMERTKHKSSHSEVIEKYENLLIQIEIEKEVDTEGFIEIRGFDLEHNDFVYRTPLIQIKKGEISNGKHLTFQYLV
ncbi:hypothetical protein ACKXGF_05055 [Alkalibacillus sp. S2W]|uniref:hypothetical protein n=1 Tax=Alkalibacillus sp. S2W TaxID=3386553 RepID=UPI00398D30AB